jgi:hypothetical protein
LERREEEMHAGYMCYSASSYCNKYLKELVYEEKRFILAYRFGLDH